MKKAMVTSCAAVAAICAFAAEPAATVFVAVDPMKELGAVKPMHAVNNGPSVKKPGGDQKNGNFEDYKAARIPFALGSDLRTCNPPLQRGLGLGDGQ